MNGRKLFNNKQGTLFLAMLIMIAVGGLFATKLIPSKAIQEKRHKAYTLRMALGQIRQAVDMKHLANPDYVFDFGDKTKIEQELKILADEHYLRNKDLSDPTIPRYMWKLDEKHFWRGTNNMALNTSFEKLDSTGGVASWVVISGSIATTTDDYLDSSSIDTFPNQNKLGTPFSTKGHAIKITK